MDDDRTIFHRFRCGKCGWSFKTTYAIVNDEFVEKGYWPKCCTWFMTWVGECEL